jgi:hypothetical protein
MNAMHAVGLHAARETLPQDSRIPKLLDRDHAVLPTRKARDESVRGGVGRFLTHVRE